MAQLQDLRVDWVSLVDRASVRDPQAKSEPRRFLLYKRDGRIDKAEKVDEAKLRKGEPMTPAEALAYARETNPHAAAIFKQHHPASDNDEDRLTKALVDIRSSIEKADDLPGPTREALRKGALALEREKLARTNPAAADAWQRSWGRHHGVAA